MTDETGNRNIRKSTVSGSMWAELGKVPPQAIKEEESLLGILLLISNAIYKISHITAEMFYRDEHKEIFTAISSLNDRQAPIDTITVVNELRKTGKMEFAGGAFFIDGLTNSVASDTHIEEWGAIIYEKYLLRKAIELASQIQTEAFEETTDVLKLLENAQDTLYQLSNIKTNGRIKSIRQLIPEVHKEVKETKDHPEKGGSGYSTGLKALDEALGGGLFKSDLIVIAARPGQGKTSLAVGIVTHMAIEYNIPVAIFSLEMRDKQLAIRIISSEIRVNSKQLRSGKVNEQELQSILSNTHKLANAPIWIDDTAGLTGNALYSKLKMYIKLHGIKVVAVDYLQIMEGQVANSKQFENREQVVSKNARTLKKVAKEFDIPVIALSQLSRAVEQRGKNKKPQLSDLKESGSVEQEADQVIFINRPETNDVMETDDGMSTRGLAEISIGKNRHGDLGEIRLYYQAKFTKFMDYEDSHQVPYSKGSGNKIADEEQEPLPF